MFSLTDNNVQMWSINSGSGALSALSPATIGTANSPQSIRISRSGLFAYVTNATSGSISMYAINQTTGVLTALSTPTIATPGGTPLDSIIF